MEEGDLAKPWLWSRKGDLKRCTEALICSGMEQIKSSTTSIKVRTRLSVKRALKKEKVLVTSSASVANWLRRNVRKGLRMLQGMYTGSYAGKITCRGVRSGM